MSITTEMIGKALSTVIDDNLKTDYVSAKWIKNIDIDGNDVSLTVELGYPAKSLHEFIRNRIATALKRVDGIGDVQEGGVNNDMQEKEEENHVEVPSRRHHRGCF